MMMIFHTQKGKGLSLAFPRRDGTTRETREEITGRVELRYDGVTTFTQRRRRSTKLSVGPPDMNKVVQPLASGPGMQGHGTASSSYWSYRCVFFRDAPHHIFCLSSLSL